MNNVPLDAARNSITAPAPFPVRSGLNPDMLTVGQMAVEGVPREGISGEVGGSLKRDAFLCRHTTFKSTVDTFRLTDGDDGPVMTYSVELTVTCVECGRELEFMGLGIGSSPSHPTVNFSGTILRAPAKIS